MESQIDTVCFYCQKEKADYDKKATVGMHKVTGRSRMIGKSTVQYETRFIHVPRCAKCLSIQQRAFHVTLLITLIGVIAGAIFDGVYKKGHYIVGGLLGLFLGWLVGYLIGAWIEGRKNIRGDNDLEHYPPAQTLIKEGWTVDIPDIED